MTHTQQAHALRQASNALQRLIVGFLGPISASPHASDTLKDTADDLSFRIWRVQNVLEDGAERLSPWPCWTIADLDRGKTVPAVKS